jgi:hypothetical protein
MHQINDSNQKLLLAAINLGTTRNALQEATSAFEEYQEASE